MTISTLPLHLGHQNWVSVRLVTVLLGGHSLRVSDLPEWEIEGPIVVGLVILKFLASPQGSSLIRYYIYYISPIMWSQAIVPYISILCFHMGIYLEAIWPS